MVPNARLTTLPNVSVCGAYGISVHSGARPREAKRPVFVAAKHRAAARRASRAHNLGEKPAELSLRAVRRALGAHRGQSSELVLSTDRGDAGAHAGTLHLVDLLVGEPQRSGLAIRAHIRVPDSEITASAARHPGSDDHGSPMLPVFDAERLSNDESG